MFFSTTQFHGFLYTEDGGKKTKFFWLALTLISGVLCVNDFVHLVIVYYGEPTNININMKVSDEVQFKAPTLCMEVIQTIIRQADWVPVKQLTTEIDKVINMTKGYSTSANIKPNVLTYTYLLLGIFTRAELYHTGQPNVRAEGLESVWPIAPGLDMGSNMSWLLHYYSNKRVSFNALKRVIAAVICSQHFGKFLQYRYPGDKHPQILPLCKPQMITSMSYSLICTKLFQSDTVPTNSSTPYKTFAITGTKQFVSGQDIRIDIGMTNKEPSETVAWGLSGDPRINYVWYLDFEGRPSLPADSRTNIFNWNPTKFLKVDVAVDRRVQMYNRKSRKCSVANDQYSCEWQNRAARMAPKCNCWPSTLMHITKPVESNLTNCYTTVKSTAIRSRNFVYEQCGQNLSYLNSVETSCLPDCTQISYVATKNTLGTLVDSGNLFDYNKDGYLEIRFQSDGNSLEITESPASSWSSFVWSFGGSMGTWLGELTTVKTTIRYKSQQHVLSKTICTASGYG